MYSRGFPKIDNSGINARIVLQQNKFSKKATSSRTWTLEPRTIVLTSFVHSYVLPTVLISIAWKAETLMILIKSCSIDFS